MDAHQQGAGCIETALNRVMSRKEFLRISGQGVAGSVLMLNLLDFLAADTAAATQGRRWATASGVIMHDVTRCTGCRLCETTCTILHDGKAHHHIGRVKIGRNLNFGQAGPQAALRSGDGQFGSLKLVGETCRQCQEPYCGNACPVGAITADATTGARVVNTAVCIGCGSCQQACPWGMATLDHEVGKATKCTLCNGSPQCVRFCPNGALRFISWHDAVKLYQSQSTR